MATNATRLTAELERTQTDIARLIDQLQGEVRRQGNDELDWGTVGSLGHVREQLIETLAFLSGLEPSEIQSSLDELHS